MANFMNFLAKVFIKIFTQGTDGGWTKVDDIPKDGTKWAYWTTESAESTERIMNYGHTPEWLIKILDPVISILKTLLLPIIIILGVAGMIYAIVLGVQYAKAENADQKEQAKKRLINAVIGIVIALVVLIAMLIFIQNAAAISGWVEDGAKGET